jgi:hypothetical protein
MILRVACPSAVVRATIDALRESGSRGHEGIVLWLGERQSDRVEIVLAYVPEHSARHDMFHIPASGMKKLQAHLRAHRWMIGAQVHSHPSLAFHSRADDDWAIVRHVGALSIVAPYFARDLTTGSFLNDCATYELDAANRWRKVQVADVIGRCEILP